MKAIIIADIMISPALAPKNPNSKKVIGKFAHGDANKKATTEEKSRTTALLIVILYFNGRYFYGSHDS